jgi:hypothetical protein
MFSALRRRLHLTPSTMISTLALVFAMSGGAYAASKYVITSTKQISPKVLKSLTGKAGASGAAGKPGANGANGATGPQGPAGAAGATGGTGKEGPAGKEGATGKEGAPGKEGSPWTAGGKLPSKKTETGTWSFVVGVVNSQTNTAVALVPISFTIPLAHAPELKIEAANYEGGNPECPSSHLELEAGEIARAAPGFLCIYPFQGGVAVEELAGLAETANGVVLVSNNTNASVVGNTGYGAWAVTAE